MREYTLSESVGDISAFENTHYSTVTPFLRTLNQSRGQSSDVLGLERKSAERIASERIKARRDENDIGNKSLSCCVNR